ncbi:hypothetical protein NC661_11895 [Aquibacillus koreensis]|uniref:Uncharacterized protein n=1 Tax=Aquibacillus koreensis TaxID=279446 RepID=A0A9X3WMT9_9BACI|nr:hypothetical protein [Aquibacillus koreensis]MCT2535212.1 hypothetical protein [Aquibacillus koreensis]MDC3421071.1 hypothetical protein [Aquibacillus koreensis]
MGEYKLEKHRKTIQHIRLYGFILIGFSTAITGNLILGLFAMLILGIVDQIIIKPNLMPKYESIQ